MRFRSSPDAALLRAAATDDRAFEELYRRHEPAVAAYLHRRTRDPHLTADLTAETFAAALVGGAKYTGEGHAVACLLGIARNQHLHWLRRGRAEDRARAKLGVGPIALGDEAIERLERLADAAELHARLAAALDDLSDDQREAVVAHVVGERSYEDLAAQLGVPAATVRQRVSRGLGRLRAAVEPGGAR